MKLYKCPKVIILDIKRLPTNKEIMNMTPYLLKVIMSI